MIAPFGRRKTDLRPEAWRGFPPVVKQNKQKIMCEYCLICGAPIGDDNPDGLGAECRAALHLAQVEKWFSEDAHRLEFYRLDVDPVREKFIELYKGVKFRSSFRRSFYETICNSERVSRKQLDVMEEMIISKDRYALAPIREDIYAKKEAYKRNIYETVEVSRELLEIARRKIRKNREK